MDGGVLCVTHCGPMRMPEQCAGRMDMGEREVLGLEFLGKCIQICSYTCTLIVGSYAYQLDTLTIYFCYEIYDF